MLHNTTPIITISAAVPRNYEYELGGSIISNTLSSSQVIADESASILMELKRSPDIDDMGIPTPTLYPSSPCLSPSRSPLSPSLCPSSPMLSPASPLQAPSSPSPTPPSNEDGRCHLINCLLCSRGVPGLLIRSPTWASIMRVVFYCLQNDNTTKQFFNLKTDVYGFMTTHWSKLCLDKKRSDNWHKQIQDMLSHSKNLFESGMEKYRQNGFWRMKQTQDPWTIRKDKKSSSKGLKRSSDGGESDENPGTKRRRVNEDSQDSNDESDLGPDSADERRNLKEEVLFLREELRKKEQESLENKQAYFKLLEQFKILQQQTELLLATTRKQRPLSPQLHQQPMNPKQWDGMHGQGAWEPYNPQPPTISQQHQHNIQQQENIRKQQLAMSGGNLSSANSPKWDDTPILRYSSPSHLHPLHFNFPLSLSPQSSPSRNDDPQLRLSPLIN